jgi:hypothetical protein
MVQLPAVNTPQFDWARSRLPRRLQPVPPIYQPDTVAEAVFRAALQGPREYWIGRPTMRAIIGQFVAPGLLDRLAARQAWEGQMTGERRGERPDNLFESVAGDHGAEGRFGQRSHTDLVSASAATVRGVGAAFGIAAAGAIGLAAGAAVAASMRAPRRRWIAKR